jgi:hypothetical protein
MRSRTRFYRIHLIACDVMTNCYWCFPPGIPILSPIPITPIPYQQKRLPRKIHLVHIL